MEVMGRRSLMMLGFGGMFVFYAVMTISFRYEVRIVVIKTEAAKAKWLSVPC